MKPIAYHPEARAEFDEAVGYYESRNPGLGVELLGEIEDATARIQQNPQLHPPYKNTGLRKCVVRRFPYTVFYSELDDRIWIAAVAHQKRRPDYWAARTPG